MVGAPDRARRDVRRQAARHGDADDLQRFEGQQDHRGDR